MLYTLNYSVLEREVYVNYTSIKLKEKLKLKKYRPHSLVEKNKVCLGLEERERDTSPKQEKVLVTNTQVVILTHSPVCCQTKETSTSHK